MASTEKRQDSGAKSLNRRFTPLIALNRSYKPQISVSLDIQLLNRLDRQYMIQNTYRSNLVAKYIIEGLARDELNEKESEVVEAIKTREEVQE